MKPVTAWYAYNKSIQGWEFNHISDGHAQESKPASDVPGLAAKWSRAEWTKYHMWLTDHLPPRLVGYSPEDLATWNGYEHEINFNRGSQQAPY